MICRAKSDIGKIRKMNQDSYVVKQDGNMTLAFVCDGMGGAKAGEIASKMACDKIIEYIDDHPLLGQTDGAEWLHDAVAFANEAVYTASLRNPAYFGMGTTLVGFLQHDDKLLGVNVGDSRLYGYKADAFSQITEDHSLVGEMVNRGLISEEESKIHPKRHILTNALGISRDIRIDIEPIQDEYEILLVASDGLHSMVDDEKIKEILASSDSLETLCEQLIDAANAAGGNDNITVVLAKAGNGL